MDAMDDEEYSGSLVTLLQAGMDFVKRNSKKAWRKTPDNRLEYPEYPERAVEEGLVNALIHRNYLELGSEIHIDMYDDRLEIYSPGGLMDGGSIKDMDVMNMASRRRNPVLADVFNRLKYMERRGSGFKKIISAYKEHEGYKEEFYPDFSTPWDSFVLTLPKFNVDGIEGVYISNGDDAGDINEQGGRKGDFTETLQKLYRNLTQTDRKIIELIVSDNFITTTQMAAQIGKSRQTIATRMKELQERGIVKRNGPDNGGFWEIIK